MEQHKISKLLNNSTLSKFMTRKWIEVNNLWNGQYSVNHYNQTNPILAFAKITFV